MKYNLDVPNGYENTMVGFSTNLFMSSSINDNITLGTMDTTDGPLSIGRYNTDTISEGIELTEFPEAKPSGYDKSFNQFYSWV